MRLNKSSRRSNGQSSYKHLMYLTVLTLVGLAYLQASTFSESDERDVLSHLLTDDSFNTSSYQVLSLNDPISHSDHQQDPIIGVLQASGILRHEGDLENMTLPTWQQLVDLYGPKPVILGLDTCEQYRKIVPDPAQRFAAPAGMFNSGTNALHTNMFKNLNAKNYMQVPWGKHRMASGRNHFHVEKLKNVNHTAALPIVIVRDPYFWMQSMCRQPYQAHWKKRPKHCPNLVISPDDRARLKNLSETDETFRVKVIHDAEYKLFYDSLAHLWNDFYQEYYHATYPRLMVRFEDLLWSAPTLLHHIAECLGTNLKSETYEYQIKRAKGHGSKSGLLEAIIKTGDVARRGAKMTHEDIEFARNNLDQQMMHDFHYAYL